MARNRVFVLKQRYCRRWSGEFLADITDIWRTGADIWGEWNRIKLCIYDQYLNVEGWKYFRKGHWPDPDMLQIGVLREGNEMPQNEQHFQVSLWAILPAPLLLSCDLNKLNDFHMSLLTNEEVIAVNQDSLGLPAKPVKGDVKVLAKPLSDGSVAIGLFNNTDEDAELSFSLDDLGLWPKPSGTFGQRKTPAMYLAGYNHRPTARISDRLNTEITKA